MPVPVLRIASFRGVLIMSDVSRCHGPGCQQQTVNGPWCGAQCREAWRVQFQWLYGDGPVQEPVIVRMVDEETDITPESIATDARADGQGTPTEPNQLTPWQRGLLMAPYPVHQP